MGALKTVTLKRFGKKYQGKTRDYYIKDSTRIIISTDRISAFDRILGYIPQKGQVLSQLSAFWFEHTRDIIKNHLIAVPDPNVLVVKNAKLIPIEMVVRGYISGVTGTSIWGSYEKGERVIYGIEFPEGLKKNQKLPHPVITPTTKAEVGHDERLTREEILKRKIVPATIYTQMEKSALALFERGTQICKKAGIILVDTKYEFGLLNGRLLLIDEIHTPDSSRFWIHKTYKEKFSFGEEPENFDKEFLRIWFKNKGYSGEGPPPKMTHDLIEQVSKRYIQIYEQITGNRFLTSSLPITPRIKDNVSAYFASTTKKISKKNALIKLAVLISNKGTGSNLQAIIDAIKSDKLRATVSMVISDQRDAQGLLRAKNNHIPTKTMVLRNRKSQEERNAFALKLADYLNKKEVDVAVFAGFGTIVSDPYFSLFKGISINVHPGLVPDPWKFTDGTPAPWNRGLMTEKAVANFLRLSYAGSTIHVVTREPDFGPVLKRVVVKVKKNDTVESLYQRLKPAEHKGLIATLKQLSRKK